MPKIGGFYWGSYSIVWTGWGYGGGEIWGTKRSLVRPISLINLLGTFFPGGFLVNLVFFDLSLE